LRAVADQSLVALEAALIRLDAQYRQISSGPATELQQQAVAAGTIDSLAMIDSILLEVQTVLGSLLKFETQNELLEIVRRLLQQEEELIQRTRVLREQEAFNDIFNQ
jgi:hypothetical protein